MITEKRTPWTLHRRREAVQKLATDSKEGRRGLKKYAQPVEYDLNIQQDGKKLTMTIDLAIALPDQLEEVTNEALWRQSKLGALKRKKTMPVDEFEEGLRVLELLVEGKKFSEISDILWKADITRKKNSRGKEVKARRRFRRILSEHTLRGSRMKLLRLPRRKSEQE